MSDAPRPPYAYVCEDHSLLLPFYRRHLAPLWFAPVPRWLPANFITLASSACMWVVFLLSLRAADFAPVPLAATFLILTQIYLGYDHVDGMQAKATGTSSALGEYLDHSLDVYHGALVVFAACALIGSMPPLVMLFVVWCTLQAFAATMVEEKERGALYFGKFGAVEAMILFNAFYLSWMIPAVRAWWNSPLVFGLPAYTLLVVGGSCGCLGATVDCLRRIGRLPPSFAAYLVTSLLLTGALARLPAPSWCAITALLLHSGDYGGRVIGSHLLRRPPVWPDFLAPGLALLAPFGPAWLPFVLVAWLALKTAWGMVTVILPLRADWRWRNPD